MRFCPNMRTFPWVSWFSESGGTTKLSPVASWQALTNSSRDIESFGSSEKVRM